VAILGIVFWAVFGGDDDNQTSPSPNPQPTNSSSPRPGGPQIPVAEGVTVTPASGWVRQKSSNGRGVYLVKQGTGNAYVNAVPGLGDQFDAQMASLITDLKKEVPNAKVNQPETVSQMPNPKISKMVIQTWTANIADQSETIPLHGTFVLMAREDGLLTLFRMNVRQDKYEKTKPDMESMLGSVTASQ
jgi:hypothetical protein